MTTPTDTTSTAAMSLAERALEAAAAEDAHRAALEAEQDHRHEAALAAAPLLGDDHIRPILDTVPPGGWTVEHIEHSEGFSYPRLVAEIGGIRIAVGLHQYSSYGDPKYKAHGEPIVVLRCDRGHNIEEPFDSLTGLGYLLRWRSSPDWTCATCEKSQRAATPAPAPQPAPPTPAEELEALLRQIVRDELDARES